MMKTMTDLKQELAKRRTFAIISHPDAGKTTVTEKLLLYGNAIQMAGTVKGRKAARHATSDWMAMEKERGISVTTSVMQFPYGGCVVNLLDTPGHEDFSEDTYRTLTAVDSAMMVIDAVKGVEGRTIKLMEVCRLRDTPIITFINKLDREGRSPLDLLDEIEKVLEIQCAPITWPVGQGRNFKGIYHLLEDKFYLYKSGSNESKQNASILQGIDNPALIEIMGDELEQLKEDLELVQGASLPFDRDLFSQGKQTPIFFGSAINNFGIKEMMDAFVTYAPPPSGREANSRMVPADDPKFSGFVFKIQANMDPKHRDRIAFLRVCSGKYIKGMKIRHLRINKDVQINNALTFMAGDRTHVDEAFAGDIIGLHNHGTIQIGDTFSQGEDLKFKGIPNFAPELFRRVRLRDPMKLKALQKGLIQLAEEGATQVFRPLHNNDLIVGAVGILQFDVVAHRLQFEYNVECAYENINVVTARWVYCDDEKMLEDFKLKGQLHLALDGGEHLCYLAPSMVNLNLTQERWPDIRFLATREH